MLDKMEDTHIETAKTVAIEFATWMEDNAWTAVYSKELKKRAYVDASKNTVLLHGSDYHFTKLINENGKTIDELYELFWKDRQEHLESLTKKHSK
ncbi:MAG: hypothetical protein WC026_13120 [Hyphomicrobium sp.]|uniref:hypothetical protein n=1 Tax=Hyphomicrobium sp. TaxID=82 RepID=UPI0035685E14